MTGPSSVSGSSGSPTFIDSAFATIASVKRSTSGRSTRIREPQTQIWPVLPKAPRALQKTALSRSASAKTMFGFLPPSSSEIRLTWDAATDRTRAPVSMPPVTDTMSTPGCSTIASPTTPPGPARTLTTPAGRSASRSSSASRMNVNDAIWAGLMIAAFPAARMAAIRWTPVQSGPFHGRISATTPIGSKNWWWTTARSGISAAAPWVSLARPPKKRSESSEIAISE